MLTIAIGIIFFVLLYASAGNGEWGAFVLWVVILVVLIGMAAGERKDAKAYHNWADYWANKCIRR